LTAASQHRWQHPTLRTATVDKRDAQARPPKMKPADRTERKCAFALAAILCCQYFGGIEIII
jgi:hypothetical protein